MAIHERKYKKFTHKQLEESLKNLQNLLQLRDWELVLDTSDDPPAELQANKEVAMVKYDQNLLKGLVWVSMKRCRENNLNPKETLAHEIFHIHYTIHDEELIANLGAWLVYGRV